MFRAPHIVFVAMALLFAQLQCAAACASQLCGADLAKTEQGPPCHRHHEHSHDRIPGSCTNRIIVSPATSPQTLQPGAPILSALGVVATMPLALPPGTPAKALDLAAFSPPKVKGLSSIVLRI